MKRVFVLCLTVGLLGAPSALLSASQADAASGARYFSNCTELQRVYPHGVGKRKAKDRVRGSTRPVTTFKRSNALYKANRHSDRDGDGVACERL